MKKIFLSLLSLCYLASFGQTGKIYTQFVGSNGGLTFNIAAGHTYNFNIHGTTKMALSSAGKFSVTSVDSNSAATGGYVYRDFATGEFRLTAAPGGGSGISGSGTADQMTFWNGSASVTGSSLFTVDHTGGLFTASGSAGGFAAPNNGGSASAPVFSIGGDRGLYSLGGDQIMMAASGGVPVMTWQHGGAGPRVGIGLSGSTEPDARLHIAIASDGSAGTGPFKIASGTLLTTHEDGVIEYDGTHWYATVGSTRYQLDQQGAGSSPPFDANTAILMDHSDNTKTVKFGLASITTGTTRTLTVPNTDLIIAGSNIANTWTGAQNMTGATVTVSTQSPGDNSTNASSTAYVDAAVAAGGHPIVFSQTSAGTALTNSTTPTIIDGTGVGSVTLAANSFFVGEVITCHLIALFSTDASPGNLSITLGFGPGAFAFTPPSSLHSQAIEITAYTTILTTGSGGTASTSYVVTPYGASTVISTNVNSSFNTTSSKSFGIQATWATASTNNSIQSMMPTTIKID